MARDLRCRIESGSWHVSKSGRPRYLRKLSIVDRQHQPSEYSLPRMLVSDLLQLQSHVLEIALFKSRATFGTGFHCNFRNELLT